MPLTLEFGDRIGLLAPSFNVDPQLGQQAAALWRELGYQTVLYPTAKGKHHPFSGTDEERLDDLQNALDDPSIRVIHCLRGGYGITRILDYLDLSALAESPKWIVGYSDVTALLLAAQQLDIACIHGPMARQWIDREGTSRARHSNALLDILCGRPYKISWPTRQDGAVEGKASGAITGGNLTLLCHTLGSKYEVETEGRILFLEEVGEPWYNTDRMLLQLRRAGKLSGLVGLIVGDFSEPRPTSTPFGSTLQEIILDHCGVYGYPIAFGFPGGHGEVNMPLPFGPVGTLALAGGRAALDFQPIGTERI